MAEQRGGQTFLGKFMEVCSTRGTNNERQVLMNKICDVDSSLIDQNEKPPCYTLLFGKENMNDSENTHTNNRVHLIN